MTKIDWNEALKPLIKKYRGKKHPLNYKSRYQLLLMVILSSQSTDDVVNTLSGALFTVYPTLAELSKATVEDLLKYVSKVRGSIKKSKWILEIAQKFGTDEKIPRTMKELIELKGIGRKSANVIISQSGDPAEGVIVDIHVLRVAPRLGIAEGDDPVKIEKQLMAVLPQESWNDAGMAFTHLGRELCRPTDPNCVKCPVNGVCVYYAKEKKKGK
jgi:endonuclease III